MKHQRKRTQELQRLRQLLAALVMRSGGNVVVRVEECVAVEGDALHIEFQPHGAVIVVERKKLLVSLN